MPLDGNVLGLAMDAAMPPITGPDSEDAKAARLAACKAMGAAIVAHIKAAGVVTVTGVGTCSTGGGPVTGTGVIT